MNSLKLKEERSSVMEKLDTLVKLAETENRELSADENVDFDSMTENVDELNKNIERAEKLESIQSSLAATSGVDLTPKAPKEQTQYRFTDAVKAAY